MDEFTGLYRLSKTLRFELKPIGKTLENIEKNGILQRDALRSDSYKEVKQIIDLYHKHFITKTLDGFQFSNESLQAFTEAYFLKDKDKIVKNTSILRSQIANAFKKAPEYKRLFAKELIREDLPKFVDNNAVDIVKQFDKFTTYFTGFHENRKNIYSEEEKSTAIAYRLINDNLFRFSDNAKSFEKIAQSSISEQFIRLTSSFSDILSGWALNEVFSICNYASFLTQQSIDCYNVLIGGRVLDDGSKVPGLNEYINLYNQIQKERSEKLPKLKPLFKMILCDRDSTSWLPAEFENDQQLLDNIEEYYLELSSVLDKGENPLSDILRDIDTYDLAKIYLINDESLTQISQNVYGDWGLIRKSLEAYYGRVNPKKENESDEKYEKRKTNFIKSTGSFSIEFLDSIAKEPRGHSIASYFSSLGIRKDGSSDIVTSTKNAYNNISDLLNTQYPTNKNLSQDKENVSKIKDFLDIIKEIQRFLKPLKGDGTEADKDARFYGDIEPAFDIIDKITNLYNMVRNRMTRKPYSIEKIKLNFDNTTLLNGWDQNKETDNCGIILKKDSLFYLLITAPSAAKEFKKNTYWDGGDYYEKMDYKLLPGPNKMLPKVFFSASRIDEFAPSEELKKNYDAGTHKKGENFNINDCHNLIDFFKQSIEKHEDWSKFGFHFSDTHSYRDLSDFYNEVEHQGYKVSFSKISSKLIKKFIEEGKAYLFQIYNKDFSPYCKGVPNLHTLYWKMLFNEKNLADTVYKLNGEAELFFRKSSLEYHKPTHPAGLPINNKNPENEKKESIFKYDLVKNRRYTVDKFQFHVPLTMNFQTKGTGNINLDVREYIKKNGVKHIIGIDRGERNLLYLCVINLAGEIVEQYSLNQIINDFNGVTYKTDYNKILEERSKQRAKARQSWQTIETIKELKDGYISQVIHIISTLIIKYNAIVVLEDLNMGFKRGRLKVEKQVYQKFEKMLIDKLNYLVDKKKDVDIPGGALKAYQLTSKFESFQKLGKQSGFIFYIPAWNTSKMDPVTGYVNLFDAKYESIEKSRGFFDKFIDIKFNESNNYFEFTFDYNDFTTRAEGTKTKWTVCTYGKRVETMRDSTQNNNYISREIDISSEMEALLKQYQVNFNDIKSSITHIDDKSFFERLLHLFRLTVSMRNSITGTDIDYIISPVANASGKFFDSREAVQNLPLDADANGAFNIARKGLWLIEQIKNAEDITKVNLSISNKEWMSYIQRQD